jgi:phosphatase NudJ
MVESKSILTSYFVLVIVRSGDRFLLIQECKHGQRWYVPAGRVEPGEQFVAAARRETLEEAGIAIDIDGILRIEHSLRPDGTARLGIILVGKPKDNRPLKTRADQHSLQAKWVRLDELNTFPLRGHEVQGMFEYVATGGTIYPITVLTCEGATFTW